MNNEIWILLIGALVAISCSLIGSFLVLRNVAMIGDAISHSVLPGIVIGFLFSGSLHSPLLLIGAGIAGVLTTYLIQLFYKSVGVQSDAAIGVVFTFLFAIGVILISVYTQDSDLDLDCVLYGEILNTPFDRWITDSGIDMGPLVFWEQLVVFAAVILFCTLFFKQLKITSFDEDYAESIGMKTSVWHYVLMAFVSFVTVASFEAVGAILVISFLITPAATAFLISTKLIPMLGVSILLGILAVFGGYYLSAGIGDTSSSAAMAVVSGIIFTFVALFVAYGKKSHTSVIDEVTGK
ncbi:MAG: metal ABC transporter permease [Cyclobacteriaceae bacterium]